MDIEKWRSDLAHQGHNPSVIVNMICEFYREYEKEMAKVKAQLKKTRKR